MDLLFVFSVYDNPKVNSYAGGIHHLGSVVSSIAFFLSLGFEVTVL